MRIIAFPGHSEGSSHEQLDAALRGEGEPATVDAWCELREDVRALTPPMSADFERLLRERIVEWAPSSPQDSAPAPRRSGSERARRRWRPRGRLRTAGALGATAALVAAIAIPVASLTGGHGGAEHPAGIPANAQATSAGPAASRQKSNSPAPRGTPVIAQAARGESSAPTRAQQLAASITLASSPDGVQSIADQVARLAVSDGGFVQSSQVQLRQEGASEANLALKVPSARLSAALASIGRLAPTRAENQSLQDITDAYDAAHRALADAVAERQALLRALSRAGTQGQIDSLREQLALAGGAITRARSALQAVSARAGMSDVEVTVIGDTHAGSEGTLDQGLHDVGDVLMIGLVVLLIGIAILVPAAALLAALVIARRTWRRYARERVLGQP